MAIKIIETTIKHYDSRYIRTFNVDDMFLSFSFKPAYLSIVISFDSQSDIDTFKTEIINKTIKFYYINKDDNYVELFGDITDNDIEINNRSSTTKYFDINLYNCLKNTITLSSLYLDAYDINTKLVYFKYRKSNKSTKVGRFKMNVKVPTFSNNITYNDINSTTLSFTNNSKTIVNGKSTLQLSNATATAQTSKGATIVSYYLNESYISPQNINNSISNFTSQNNKITIRCEDNYGNSTNTIELANEANFITYKIPKLSNFSAERDSSVGGVSEETSVDFNGYYTEGYQIGANNLIATYKYKKVEDVSWNTGTSTLTLTKSKSNEQNYLERITSEINNSHIQKLNGVSVQTNQDLFACNISFDLENISVSDFENITPNVDILHSYKTTNNEYNIKIYKTSDNKLVCNNKGNIEIIAQLTNQSLEPTYPTLVIQEYNDDYISYIDTNSILYNTMKYTEFNEYYSTSDWNSTINDLYDDTKSYIGDDLLETTTNRNKVYLKRNGSYSNWSYLWRDLLYNLNNIISQNGGSYTFSCNQDILGDTSNGFDMGYSYNIQLIIEDSFENEITSISTIQTANPAIDIYKDKVAIHGIYDETNDTYPLQINGNTEVDGDLNITGSLLKNGNDLFQYKVLWGEDGSAYYMTSGHVAYLSENISAQKNGIVLHWCAYTPGSGVQGWGHFFTYIPKGFVALYPNGPGLNCGHSSGADFSPISSKYVYVYNNRIVGNDGNSATGTKNGVTFANNRMVLVGIFGM